MTRRLAQQKPGTPEEYATYTKVATARDKFRAAAAKLPSSSPLRSSFAPP